MHVQRRLRRVVFGTARAAVYPGKKLHLKVRQTEGESQSSLFFKLLWNSSRNTLSTVCPDAKGLGGYGARRLLQATRSNDGPDDENTPSPYSSSFFAAPSAGSAASLRS